MFSSYLAITLVMVAFLSLLSQVESQGNVAMLCDYTSLGYGTSCSGPDYSWNPWAYDAAEYINPRFDSSLGTGAARFEYCQEFCNNHVDCLGFLTDPGNPDFIGEFDWVRCYISTQEPTGVYNDGINSLETCQKKIVGSCVAAPVPKQSPTAPPPTPAPTNTIQDCQSCLNADCTWCEASFSSDSSKCECRYTCSWTFTERMSCDKENEHSFFHSPPWWFWLCICILSLFVCIMLCTIRQKCMNDKSAAAGDATFTANVHSATAPTARSNTNVGSSGEANRDDGFHQFMVAASSSIFGEQIDNVVIQSPSNPGGTRFSTADGTSTSTSNYGGNGFSNSSGGFTSSSNDCGGSGFSSSSNDFGGGGCTSSSNDCSGSGFTSSANYSEACDFSTY